MITIARRVGCGFVSDRLHSCCFIVEISVAREANRLPLSKVLTDASLAETQVLLMLAIEVTQVVHSLHKVPVVLAEIDVNSVVVKNWKAENDVC